MAPGNPPKSKAEERKGATGGILPAAGPDNVTRITISPAIPA